MKKPFEWHHSLLYADKPLEAYTISEKGSLDELLYRMYRSAHNLKGIMIAPSKAFNIAYYLAVAVYRTPHMGVDDWTVDCVRAVVSKVRIMLCDGGRKNCTTSEIYLVNWMVWTILTLQERKPEGLEVFLDKYRQKISWMGGWREGAEWERCRFVKQFSEMVKIVDGRFNTDLDPCPLSPSSITDELWSSELQILDSNEFLQFLCFYRTQKEQKILIDMAYNKHMEKITPQRLEMLRREVWAGCLLPKSQSNPQSSLSLADEKTKALEAQVEALRKAIEQRDATDRANQLVQDFDKQQERRFEEYRKKSDEEKAQLRAELAQVKAQANALLAENRELREALEKKSSEKQKDILLKMARESVEVCIAEMVDIDNPRYDERDLATTTGQEILKMLVQRGFARYIDESAVQDIVMLISDVRQNRDDATKRRNKQAKEASDRQRHSSQVNVYGTYNENVTTQQIMPGPVAPRLRKGGEL